MEVTLGRQYNSWVGYFTLISTLDLNGDEHRQLVQDSDREEQEGYLMAGSYDCRAARYLPRQGHRNSESRGGILTVSSTGKSFLDVGCWTLDRYHH